MFPKHHCYQFQKCQTCIVHILNIGAQATYMTLPSTRDSGWKVKPVYVQFPKAADVPYVPCLTLSEPISLEAVQNILSLQFARAHYAYQPERPALATLQHVVNQSAWILPTPSRRRRWAAISTQLSWSITSRDMSLSISSLARMPETY